MRVYLQSKNSPPLKRDFGAGLMRSPSHGFSLIDVVVGVALMLVLFLALFGVLRASLVLSTLAKAKAAGVEIASTQMEYLRGFSYDALGTVGGIPAGIVPQFATSTVDGVVYVTHTYIEYYDDPKDGAGVGDTNHVTTDYKAGKVTVSYSINGLAKSITLVSNFVPPGIESTTGGGTLSLHVVNASGASVPDANVQIINTATSPTVNFTTFSDINGLVLIGGAATSSQYQIQTSRTGYSSAQTYARTAQSVNPTPGYLTVVKDQTTSATFSIDTLASLTLSSFSPASTTSFTDTFAGAGNVTDQNNTQITGEALSLSDDALSGSAYSIPISPSLLTGWGILSATLSTTSGSSVIVRVDDASHTPIPDAVLPNNSTGFSSFPIFLTNLATSSYPTITLEVDLSRNATTTNPALKDWSLTHTEGPSLSPNTSFTLTGSKTIGTNASGLPIYKTVVSDTTGAGAIKTETLEWDAYTLALSGMNLIESCPTIPYPLAPSQASSTSLIVGTLTPTTLPIIIENNASNSVPYAKVVLSKSDYASTELSSECGFVFFNGLTSGTYSATVSAPGHTPRVFSNIIVAGHTATTTLILP